MHTSEPIRTTIVYAAFVALSAISAAACAAHADIDRIVAFGASLSDTGNAFAWLSEPENRHCGTALNVPPYDALDELATPDGPYAVGGHHYTNGATWIEGLARHFALAGNSRPAFRNDGTASNYAVGGARAVADYPCRVNLPAQIDAYVADFPQTSARTLVAIEIGGNDVRDALVAAAAGADPVPMLENALASLGTDIVRLYGHGARKFLVLNVADIGKTPAVRMLDAQMPGIAYFAGYLSASYNAGLAAVVQNVAGLPGIRIDMLDVHTTLDAVVAHPADYGFVDVVHACVTPDQPPFRCANPDAYVFWDGIHPTQALHALVAQQAITTVEGF